MAKSYVVEVNKPSAEDPRAAAKQLAEAFKVELAKVERLIKRLPDVVTKPVSETEAVAVARRFREAGFAAEVREAALVTSPITAPPPQERGEGAMELSAAELKSRLAGTARAQPPTAEAGAASPARSSRRQLSTTDTMTDSEPGAARRRGSLRRKLLSVAIIPTVLTVLGALVVVYLTARPALYEQLLESARNPAIATAASLSNSLAEQNATEINYLQLLDTILITRQAFERGNISFIVSTDLEGNPLPGYFAGSGSFTAGPGELENAIRKEALAAIAQGPNAEDVSSTRLEVAGGNRIEIVAQPLSSGGEPFGAIVVGVSDKAVVAQVNRILLYIFLFSLIPITLAILIAYFRSRGLTSNVLYLTEQADQISRGDLDESVDLDSNDELEDLSGALERMRISMKEALDRLRRRRI